MSNKAKKAAALMSVCAIVCGTFASCSDNASQSNFGNYTDHGNWDTAPEESCAEYEESEEQRPDQPSANEDYHAWTENGFKDPEAEPLSTFSVDVDTASYSNARRLIEDGMSVPEDSVRVEEFINYFDYDYPDPEDGEVFGKYVEVADCPWNSQHKLMMVGIQGKRMAQEEIPPSNLVFLIDTSGSMSAYNKLPLVQTAFSMLAEKLTGNDRISIVTYAGSSEIVLAGADGSDKDRILEALYSLTASGSTNGEGGIQSAYELAEKCFIEGGNNRVILATDGDLNVGASSENELKELIEKKRDSGIYLSVLGFGTGNYKDDRLEALADNGNGNYSYIDSVDEAQRVLVSEMGGTLYTIAKDVKVQVEFNPSQVKSYRLIGYDNRLMDAEDFYDDSKDAGEVGSGHSVTALYEVELASSGTYHGIDLEFADQHAQPLADNKDNSRTEICKLSLAYKDINTDEVTYRSALCGQECFSDKPSDVVKLAGAAAEFAMLLKNSQYKGDSSYSSLADTVDGLSINNEKVSELSSLIHQASSLST